MDKFTIIASSMSLLTMSSPHHIAWVGGLWLCPAASKSQVLMETVFDEGIWIFFFKLNKLSQTSFFLSTLHSLGLRSISEISSGPIRTIEYIWARRSLPRRGVAGLSSMIKNECYIIRDTAQRLGEIFNLTGPETLFMVTLWDYETVGVPKLE